MNGLLNDSVMIIKEGTSDKYNDILEVLEDANSPITKEYREKLYQSVVNKSHIDFGDIPKSKGDINSYSGVSAMNDTLNTLLKFANDNGSKDLKTYVNTVMVAIENIVRLKSVYQKGFTTKNDYVMLEYNTFVFTCVEGTTSLLYNFIDYIKTPSSPSYKIVLKDTKYRADLFYIEQLEKFNRVNVSGNYSKFLQTTVNSGKENFFGLDDAMVIGVGAVAAVALSIVPVTRSLIYNYKELKRKLSESTALMAYYLEMNKSVVDANSEIKPEKKKKILEKQEKVRTILLKISNKLRITSVKAEEMSKKDLSSDNKAITMGNLRTDVDDSDYSFM